MKFETRILQWHNPVRTSLQSFSFPTLHPCICCFVFCLLICARLISTYNLIINTRNHSDLIQQKTWRIKRCIRSLSRIRQQVPLLLVRESGDTADAVDLSEWCWWNWLEHVSDLARSIHCAEHLKCSAPTNPLWLMVQRRETKVSDSPGWCWANSGSLEIVIFIEIEIVRIDWQRRAKKVKAEMLFSYGACGGRKFLFCRTTVAH